MNILKAYSNERENHSSRKYLMLVVTIATFGGLLFGYDTGVINGALPYMSQPGQLDLNPLGEGFVASSLLLGAAFGALFVGRLSDFQGRRKTILQLSVVFIIATIGCSLAPNFLMMIISRFILGIAVGGASVTVPTFLAEMAPAEKRGRLVTQNELMIVSGQFLAFLFNALLGNMFGDTSHFWRYMLLIAAIPAAVLGIGMLFMPESPRWLAGKRRDRDALDVFKKVREPKQASAELEEVKTAILLESKQAKVSIKDLNIKWIRNIVLLGIGIGAISQLTGVNSIMYYGTQILQNSGFETEVALIANIANGIISVLACITGLYLLGKVGRRPMFITGLAGTTTSLVLIGIFSIVFDGSDWLPYLVLSMTIMFLAFYQGSIGPLTWLTLAEIFPMRLRGLGMGAAVFCLWMMNFLVGLFFPVLMNSVGISMTFFIFAGFGILGLVFIIYYLPETKGLSLEEVERYFRNETEEIRKISG
ncbi:major facilitator transporter [Bacillus sp. SA1-12]|uniref:sugar porter family MFS transporter n=1 Tax=Bacillus sp. SA1-12 TaxID=1455638 RepID=UPI00062550E7|nr:sugar porter family MFS transporter [Bacillus sp. SA1-12]KKI93504.1 major facilitator transporter [Bacillus sp. SA1-12]